MYIFEVSSFYVLMYKYANSESSKEFVVEHILTTETRISMYLTKYICKTFELLS